MATTSSSALIKPLVKSNFNSKSIPQSISKLGSHIVYVVIDESIPDELTRYKILRGILYTLGTSLSFASCIVPSYISWKYEQGKPGIQVLEVGGILGVTTDFGIFGSYGYILIADRFVQWLSNSREYQELFIEEASPVRRITHVSIGLLWGGSSRLTAIGLGVKFAKSMPLGIVGAVGGAGPAIWSAFQTVGHLIEKTKDDGFFSTASEKELRRIKKNLLGSLTKCRQAVSQMSSNERGECLKSLTFSSVSEPQDALSKIQILFSEIIDISKIKKNTTEESCITTNVRRAIKAPMLIPATMVLLQLWLLANTALQTASDDSWINSTIATIVVSSFALFIYSETQNGTDYLYNRIADNFTSVNKEVNEAEVVFGKLSYLLDVLGIAIALLPYADLVSISQQYATDNTICERTCQEATSNTFIYGSYIGWTILIFQSVRKLLIARVSRSYASRFSPTEVKRDMVILQKLGQLHGIIQESNLSSFNQLLTDLPVAFPRLPGPINEDTHLLQDP